MVGLLLYIMYSITNYLFVNVFLFFRFDIKTVLLRRVFYKNLHYGHYLFLIVYIKRSEIMQLYMSILVDIEKRKNAKRPE